jgi:hypothetical protein
LEDEIMVVRLSGTQPQGPKQLETLENKTVDGTQNTVRINRGATANRPSFPVVGEFYYNTDKQAFEQYTLAGWFNIAQAPSAPTSLVATNQGTGRSFNNGQASVTFTPNSNGGAPSSFIITPSPATSPATFTVTSSPATITGLSSSTQYTYTATAVGSYGTSSASSASSGVTATTVPQEPSLVATALDSTSASIAITPGATGGSAITQYSIVSNPITTTQTTSSSPYTFTGLTVGNYYTFTAYASNALGNSLLSSASNSITPALPSNPMYESIASYKLTSDTLNVTFSSIPSTYKHLQLRALLYSAGDDYVYFNTNLTPTKRFSIGGRDSTLYPGIAGPDVTGYEIYFGGIAPAAMAGLTMDFVDYKNTNISKTVKQNFGYGRDNQYTTENQYVYGFSGNGAINSITIRGRSPYNIGSGSTIALYGIKVA